jgi:hypothetical protein
MYLALKTDGDIRHRARALAVKLGAAAAVVAVVFLVWTQARTGALASSAAFVLAALALVAGVYAAWAGREGWAFTGTFLAIALAVAGLFLALFPDVMPSTTDPAFSLTTTNASATAYTLKIMTWVAVLFTPLVLLYQGWTYWIFRKRISTHHIPAPPSGSRGGRRPPMRPVDPRLLPHLAPARTTRAGALVGSVAAGLLVVAQAFAVAALITRLLDGDTGGAARAGAALVGVLLGRAAAGWGVDACTSRASAQVTGRLRRQVLGTALALGVFGLSRRHSG